MSTPTQTSSVIHGRQPAPPKGITAVELAPLRSLLAAAGFTEADVCTRTGAKSIYDFRSIREGRTEGLELNDALDVLIRLFMDVEMVDRGAAESALEEYARAIGRLHQTGRSAVPACAPG